MPTESGQERPLADEDVYSARPVIEVDGQTDPLLDELFVAMDFDEPEGGLASMELAFLNWTGEDFAFEDERLLALGKKLKVKAGAGSETLFDGRVSGLELGVSAHGVPTLTVLAEDALQKLRMARRTAVHEDGTVAALVQALCAEHSLTVTVEGLDATTGQLVQLNESDLSFLRRVLAVHGGDIDAEGDRLKAGPRGSRRGAPVTVEVGGQLRDLRLLADLSHQVTSVTIAGWDPAAGQDLRYTSTGEGDLGPGQGRTGAELLEAAFGERAEHVGHVAVRTDGDCRAVAEAALAARARRLVAGTAVTEGNPLLRVGSVVDVARAGPRFSGSYTVTRSRHTFDLELGYLTRLELERAFLGRAQ